MIGQQFMTPRDPRTGEVLTTKGEALLGRKLARVTMGGVEHYAPGQMVAMVDRAPDLTDVLIGFVSYVNQRGEACLVLYDYGETPRARDHAGDVVPHRWRPHVRLSSMIYVGPGQQTIDADRSPVPASHIEALEEARKRGKGLG